MYIYIYRQFSANLLIVSGVTVNNFSRDGSGKKNGSQSNFVYNFVAMAVPFKMPLMLQRFRVGFIQFFFVVKVSRFQQNKKHGRHTAFIVKRKIRVKAVVCLWKLNDSALKPVHGLTQGYQYRPHTQIALERQCYAFGGIERVSCTHELLKLGEYTHTVLYC